MAKSVMDFGAIGDGRCDDYEAFHAALNSCEREIYIPHGVYNISETLKVPSDKHIIAAKTAKIVMKPFTRRHRGDFLLSNADETGGNVNIKIEGGIWDGNNTAPENAKPDIFEKNGYSGVLLNFRNVHGLTLRDMVLANSVTYYTRFSGVHDFHIENIDFVSDTFGVNQDGLHFGGDVRHGFVKNIRALSFGQTNDDMVALNADDSVVRVENLDLTRDVIEDITFEDICTENCHTVIRLLSVTAPIRNIRFKNIYAGFRCYAVNADGARYCRTPLFTEEEYPNGAGDIHDIMIENFTCYPVLDLPESFGGTHNDPTTALMMETVTKNFTLTGFKYPEGKCPAASFKNLVDETVTADGEVYRLEKKEDILEIRNFKDIQID